jgi:hypothetical protein
MASHDNSKKAKNQNFSSHQAILYEKNKLLHAEKHGAEHVIVNNIYTC